MSKTTRSNRKEIVALTADDMVSCPIWEGTLAEKAVGPYEGELRPRADLDRYDPWMGTGVFVVRTKFRLADGTDHIGYSTPTPADIELEAGRLGYMQPAVFAEGGQQVPFWFVLEHDPPPDFATRYYETLGRTPDAVFPVTFETSVPVTGHEASGGEIGAFQGFVVHGASFEFFERR